MLKSRKEFIEMYRKLEELSETYNKKVLFVIFKNKQILKEILDIVITKESEIISDEYKNFEIQRRNLLLIYCERDSENKPIVQNEQFVIKQEQQNKFNEVIKQLFDDYKEVIGKYEEDKNTFEAFVNEKIELDFAKFSFNDLPEDMSIERYSLLSNFIKETEEELIKLV